MRGASSRQAPPAREGKPAIERPRRTPAVLFLGALLVSVVRASHARELSDQEVLQILASERPRDRAIDRGLAWLRSQQREDGSLAEGKHRTALTSLAVMAHLAAGVTFTDPVHGPWMRRALGFVLSMQEKSGYFGKKDGSRMYGHGITALMLAESIGMVQDEELEEHARAALERALGVTVAAARVKKKERRHAGGWRYHPDDAGADLSLSGWQLMSLHAAQQVGIPVDEEVIRKAVEFASGLTTPEGKVGYDRRGDDRPGLRGLGMLCFAIGREERDEVVTRIGKRILQNPIAWRGPWFFYRAYYDAVGMSRARPEMWEQYAPRLEKVLVEHQKKDGAWATPPGDNESENGQVYLTSMSILALTVDRHVLPAYQR